MTSITRIGLLGDVHAADEKLEHAIEHLRTEGVDQLICVGDIVDGIGDVDRCIDLLRHHDVLTVRGNHDRWILANEMRSLPDAHAREELEPGTLQYLANLAPTAVIDTDAGPVLLSHGVGEDDMFELRPWTGRYDIEMHDGLQSIVAGPSRWAVGGHSHQPMVRDIGGTFFVNPGPIAALPESSVALLGVGEQRVSFWRIDESFVPFSPSDD